MKENKLVDLSMQFAVDTLKLCESIKLEGDEVASCETTIGRSF